MGPAAASFTWLLLICPLAMGDTSSEPSQCSPFRLVNKIVDSDDLLWVYGPSPPDCVSDNVENSALDYLSVVAYDIGSTDHLQKMLNNDSQGLINKAVHQLQVEN